MSSAFPEPSAVETHGPARAIAMVNQKGGVGKTTSSVSLGAALAGYGRRVLLVDFDPQASMTIAFGLNPDDPSSVPLNVYNLIMDAECHVGDVVITTDVVRLDLLPGGIELSGAEQQLVNEVGREKFLARALAPVMSEYDFIIIDCQPSLGLLTTNALVAAHDVIIPMNCEYLAMRGVKLLLDTIDKVQTRLDSPVNLLGVLGTMYDPRTLHSREVLERMRERFGTQVFQTHIPRTIRFSDATVAGEPITSYLPDSNGAEAYEQLAREVLAR